MDILSLLGLISAFLIIIFVISLLFAILLIYLVYRFAKKNPILSIFLIVLIFVIATLEVITIEGIASGITTYIAGLLSILFSYKRLKQGLKQS